jgi:transposase
MLLGGIFMPDKLEALKTTEKKKEAKEVNEEIIRLRKQAENLRTISKNGSCSLKKSFSDEFFKGVDID